MMPSIFEAYTLFIEGVIQIVVGLILLITVARRGKNRMLTAMAWFFIAVGIFSLGPFFPASMKLIPGISALIAYSSVVCHTSVFFGVAGYCGVQFGLLKGARVLKWTMFTGFAVAFILSTLHILSLPSVNIDPVLKTSIGKIAEWAMFGMFAISLILVSAIFFSLAWQMRRDKGALNYASTTGLGLVALLAALTIRKALDTLLPNLFIDLLTFLSLGLVVVGTIFQISVSMSPGIVYDSKSKKPVVRALVRLIRTADNKLVESRITGSDGRYGLLVEAGKYKLSVVAAGFAEHTGSEFEINKPTLVGMDVQL